MGYIPLKMRPCYKEYLWGGTRLKTEFGKADAPDVTAESWELSCHSDGLSLVDGGAYAGKSIAELGEIDREGFWGSACRSDIFPVLVKLIDAKKDLSIQVHPSDQTARTDLGEQGKAEMWYIVDCEPQACIYFGFSKKISKEEFLRRARDGSICEVLNRVPVAKGDVFYILPGTIHAIGAGIVIAEIQQNSNTTFRVYDYQRKGTDGKLRPLHLERAAEVVSYEPIIPEECKANSCVTFPEFTMTEMFSCTYFRAYRVDVKTAVTLLCDGQSFQHLLCVEGWGTIRANGQTYSFQRGDSFFMPAALGEYKIEGVCRMLLSRI
jgi:mannose-6-phosphate isomerase